jgi:hypothetical protein
MPRPSPYRCLSRRRGHRPRHDNTGRPGGLDHRSHHHSSHSDRTPESIGHGRSPSATLAVAGARARSEDVVPTAGLPSLVLGPGILPGRRPAVTPTGQSAPGFLAGTMIKAALALKASAPGRPRPPAAPERQGPDVQYQRAWRAIADRQISHVHQERAQPYGAHGLPADRQVSVRHQRRAHPIAGPSPHRGVSSGAWEASPQIPSSRTLHLRSVVGGRNFPIGQFRLHPPWFCSTIS